MNSFEFAARGRKLSSSTLSRRGPAPWTLNHGFENRTRRTFAQLSFASGWTRSSKR